MAGKWGSFDTCPNGRYVDIRKEKKMAMKLKVLKDYELTTGSGECVPLKEGDEIVHNQEFLWRIEGDSSLYPSIPWGVFARGLGDGSFEEVPK